MGHRKPLRVLEQAHQNLEQLVELLRGMRDIGDLKSQAQRSAISVISNIAEGAGFSDRVRLRHLGIARGSNNELEEQVRIVQTIRGKNCIQLLDKIDYTGRMLSKLIRAVENRC